MAPVNIEAWLGKVHGAGGVDWHRLYIGEASLLCGESRDVSTTGVYRPLGFQQPRHCV
ncbi:MAG: hypothetical protein QXN04_11200 [Pyrobaculum sp.]